jgi:hypothetical protein
MRRRAFIAALAALAFATAAIGQTPPAANGAPAPGPNAASQRVGERCPPGRWYTEGGNAAHNAASDEPPLLRRPVVAWRHTLPGTLLGEPLVWGEHVVLALRLSPTRTAIEARRLADGAVIGQRALDSATDPVPCLWGDEIVWRVGTGGLELARVGKASVDFVARMPAAKTVDAPLRVGTNVLAVVDGVLTCMRAADFRVVWQALRRDCRGQVAVAGDVVYAIGAGTGADGGTVVGAFDRATGRELAVSAAVPASPETSAVRVQVAGDQLFARLAAGHAFPSLRAKATLNALEVSLPLAPERQPRPEAMPVARALDPRVQIAAIDTGEGIRLGLFREGSDDGVRLDTCELHRSLAAVPPTLARDVVYFGACAVDTTGLRLLWRVDADENGPVPAVRAIPAARTLLLGHDRVLVALREPRPADPVAAELAAWQAAHERERLAPLVDAALRARDAELAGDLLARARELAADEGWAQKRDKELAALRRDAKAKPDGAKAAAARSQAAALPQHVLDAVQQHVGGWSARPAAEQRRGLRHVLEQAPDHAGALAAVRALLPAAIEPESPLHGIDWLDWLDAAAHTTVSFLDATPADLGRTGVDDITAQEQQQLLEWRSRWRADLIALRSDRLVLFSPIAQPGSLAKALATGELVCDALEAMFADLPKVRHDPRRMLVFVYPDRAEYLAEAKKLGIDAESTAGFYTAAATESVAKSRLHVPPDDTGFATVLPTLAHELTHHWLADRCPAFVPDPVALRAGTRAYWIVEGFAGFVEQFEFDVAARSWRLGAGNLERADLVASATAAQLLDWDRLVATTRVDFDRLRLARKAAGVPSRMRLGTSFQARAIDLFYAQAAMLARYLYDADGGKHRDALLRYVTAWYTGDAAGLDFERAFGTTAATLGPHVVAYARALGP